MFILDKYTSHYLLYLIAIIIYNYILDMFSWKCIAFC